MGNVRIHPDEGVDDLLHGELKLIQKRRGYRYSVDALLLCHFVLPVTGLRVIDLGCGSGVIPLILAKRSEPREIIGVEIQAALAGMARRNVRLNSLEDRILIIHRDMKKLREAYPRSGFDLVVSNPPFIPEGTGQLNRLREKSVARHELKIDLAGIISLSRHLVRPSGKICLIYPTGRLAEVKAGLRGAGLYISRLQFALDRPGGVEKLFCIEAGKKQVSRLRKLKPVYIETAGGKFAI